ncbi:MAG: hypothetical protein AAB353_09145 [Candidatus Hydrogenedentota bacterium]
MSSIRMVVAGFAAVAAVTIGARAQEVCCEGCKIPVRSSLELSATTVQDTWDAARFGNRVSPISGKPVSREHYVEFADAERTLYGRVYVADAGERIAAEMVGAEKLYRRVYLGSEDAEITQAVLELKNTFCPVSGVGAKEGQELAIDPTMATNCTAGGCSVGDGFGLTYNGIRIRTCCPSCGKMFAKTPEKFTVNLQELFAAATRPAKSGVDTD